MEKWLIVITWASSGIWEATAKLFSEAWYPTLLLARRIEKLKSLNLKNSISEKTDVTDIQQLKNSIRKAEEKFWKTQCIINNAWMMLLWDITDQNPEEWKKMFDVNILGVLNGMQAVLPSMKKRKSWTIINISSIAGRKTFPNHAAYCWTKFGVHAITENVREEAAKDNIRMVTIAPGAVETELLSHTTSVEIKNWYEAWKKNMWNILYPKDIANAIWYAFNQPEWVNVREIVIAATRQEP